MKKLIFLLALLISANQAAADTVYCTNCSSEFIQMLERATSLEELGVIYDTYHETIQQTEQQLQILLTEIDQYNNMLQNTVKLPARLVNNLTGGLGRLARLTREIEVRASEVTALGGIFEQIYMDDDFLQGIARAGRDHLPSANQRYNQQRGQWEREVSRAEEAAFKLSGQQLHDLINDGPAFEKHMRELLSTPSGQMQALEAANELTAIHINETRQLRTLLTTSAQAAAIDSMKREREKEMQDRVWPEATRTDKLQGVSGKNAAPDPF